MNKSAIKGFAVRARRRLIEDITQKAYALGIKDAGKYDEIEEFEGGFRIKDAVHQIVYPMTAKKDREKLISEINRKGFEQVVEEVAYTWFNRIIAIRFMEVNEYLPVKVRILSSEIEGKVEPDVLTNIYDYVDELELDKDRVFELKENHKDEELFKYVFVRECNNLGKLMPQVFESIGDYTERLLPDQLLVSGSVIRDLIESIDEEDFREEVEIIGWMYQYYNSEVKATVDKKVKDGGKVEKYELPAKTQLFTPDWIVRYMVENSLGKVWLGMANNSALSEKWKFSFENSTKSTTNPLISSVGDRLDPKSFTVIDPCMGSGHILVYVFDVLMQIYESVGYTSRDAAQSIVEHNLFGLDIDDRASQIAYFAIMMKARKFDRRFFSRQISPRVYSIKESNNIDKNHLKYFGSSLSEIEREAASREIEYLVQLFNDSKKYGSILEVNVCNWKLLKKYVCDYEIEGQLTVEVTGIENTSTAILDLIEVAKIMAQKYDIVITNPPYLGLRAIEAKTLEYIKNKYPNSKNDFFAVFIERSRDLTKEDGFFSLVTAESWLSLSSFEKLRESLLMHNTIINMLHLGENAFDAGFGTVAFVISKKSIPEYKGTYFRLIDIDNSEDKINAVISKDSRYIFHARQKNYDYIEGSPISYWVSDSIFKTFGKYRALRDIAEPRQGLTTCDNKRFVRYWTEVDFTKVGIGCNSLDASVSTGCKWFPYNKGGEPRKWYGNNDYIVNWENDGTEIKTFVASKYKSYTRTVKNIPYYFNKGLTWSAIAKRFAVRAYSEGYIFADKGQAIFCNDSLYLYLCGLLNCKYTEEVLKIVSPTLDFNCGYIKKIPIAMEDDSKNIEELVRENINLSKEDWDSFEESWEFEAHPFIGEESIRSGFINWAEKCDQRFDQVKLNEEALNEKFADIYILQEELESTVNEDEISIRRAEIGRDVRSFISYAVGCMFGRYSLDSKGLVFAGGNFNITTYQKYKPANDNIILITEEEYFGNDIYNMFVQFLKTVFKESSTEEQLCFIAKALNPNSKSSYKKIIRNYFIKDFYKDHKKVYKKSPIYWMIDSGKQNGVKALFYMHRYDKSTIARFRTDYLHEVQRYYENDIELTEKTNDKKRVDKLKKKLQEVTEFDKVVAHIAHQQIEFDLDDGVEHNYKLFQDIEVPQGHGQKPLKANLLAKRK